MRALKALALSLFVASACLESSSSPPGDAATSGPHCTRPSTVACDQPTGRQEACVCDVDSNCESGYCGLEGKYCQHVCQWKPIAVALGDRCDCGDTCLAGTYCLEACPSGAYCKDLGLESRCAPLEDVGGACSTAWGQTGCKAGLVCVMSGTTGSCTATNTKGVGEACSEGWQCASGLFCDPFTMNGTCQALKATGEPCRAGECADRYALCNVACGTDQYCCSASNLGKGCGTTSDCTAQGLYCSTLDHTCHAVLARGAACDPNDDADQCPSDVMTHYSSRCDPTSKTCVGGYCQ